MMYLENGNFENVKSFSVIKSYEIHNIYCVSQPGIECIEEATWERPDCNSQRQMT